MPTKPARWCSRCSTPHNGPCPQATKERDEIRGSARQRGYTTAWDKAAKAYLGSHPLCVHCEQEGRMEGAVLVDHIQPAALRPDLFWIETNWQGLCRPHHAIKTAEEKKGTQPKGDKQHVVVCGRPGSGKSTYVNQRKQVGEFIWDWDVVCDSMFGTRDLTPQSHQLVLDLFNAAMYQLGQDEGNVGAWVIVTEKRWAESVAQQINAELVVLDTSVEECERRLTARDSGIRLARLVEVARAW